MRYVSIDIETTGLVAGSNNILEIGAIIEDTEVEIPVEQLPTFHTYVLPPRNLGFYRGDPFAMHMNVGIITRIALFLQKPKEEQELLFRSGEFMYPEDVSNRLGRFLILENGLKRIWPAGKNFASFDRRFLEELPEPIKFGHRTLDPMTYWLRPSDKEPPNLQECCDRAGLGKVVTHTAVEDARLVIKLIRAGMKRQPLDMAPDGETPVTW